MKTRTRQFQLLSWQTILYYLAVKGITEKEIKAAWKSGNEYIAGLNGEYFKCFEIKDGIKSV